jgi:hypothetical protein
VSVDIVGYVFLGIIAVFILIGVGMTLSSIPDIRRYRRVRKM